MILCSCLPSLPSFSSSDASSKVGVLVGRMDGHPAGGRLTRGGGRPGPGLGDVGGRFPGGRGPAPSCGERGSVSQAQGGGGLGRDPAPGGRGGLGRAPCADPLEGAAVPVEFRVGGAPVGTPGRTRAWRASEGLCSLKLPAGASEGCQAGVAFGGGALASGRVAGAALRACVTRPFVWFGASRGAEWVPDTEQNTLAAWEPTGVRS